MATATLEQSAHGAAGAERDALMEARQFVTFFVGNEVFAVPMAPVREIIRVPDVVRVPLSPPSLEGLANLRGLVLPVVSLRRLFRFPDRTHDDATRALVIDFGAPAGFVVDRVASVITVELDQIESATAIQATIDSDLLLGVIKNVSGHEMVMILDFAQLIKNEFASLAREQTKAGAATSEQARETAKGSDGSSDELQLVSFVVAGQEYAIAIERVQEIVQVPEQIIHVPKAAAHVIGVMTLRQRLLPLVSLRRMFNLPAEALGEHNRIVVISLSSGGDQLAVGVITDTVNEVLRVSSSLVDTMPALLARDADIAEITDICRLNDGKRLVSIISAEKMFAHSAFREAAAVVSELQEGSEAVVTDKAEGQGLVGEDEQMVVFRLMKEEFGVPIDSVQEIVRVPDQLAHVPKAPEFIEGVINLRGAVLPVVDQRRRFGLPSQDRNDRQRIMVFTINGVRTGFIVDSVTEVLKIPRQAIEDAPNLSEETAKLIRRVANLQKQKRMILLLDVDQLLESGEVTALEIAALH
ncbi:MAG: chemotaxis protein CheW [Candidatus Competibacteraceae bacterium]|nr:chemotaxis protein CheW [Candidatus Competibacteraceae bacterium]